jgi:hypothetical protein
MEIANGRGWVYVKRIRKEVSVPKYFLISSAPPGARFFGIGLPGMLSPANFHHPSGMSMVKIILEYSVASIRFYDYSQNRFPEGQ